jgi:hypothetical protein
MYLKNMEKDFKTEKAFSGFARELGNPYALKKNEDAVKKILKDYRVENLSREPGHKQSDVLKKIAKITNLEYKTRKAVLAYGEKEAVQTKTTARQNGIFSPKTSGAVGVGAGERRTLVQDFSVSNNALRNNGAVVSSINENGINDRTDNVRNRLKGIQS